MNTNDELITELKRAYAMELETIQHRREFKGFLLEYEKEAS